MEMKYDLLSYGVPTQLLPIDGDGRLEMIAFMNEIEERKEIEKRRIEEKRKQPQHIQSMLAEMELEIMESSTTITTTVHDDDDQPVPITDIPASASPVPSSMSMSDGEVMIGPKTNTTNTNPATTTTGVVVDHPAKFDVLLGRGRPYQEFPGNNNLAEQIGFRQDDYERGTRYEKAVLIQDVVQQIHGVNGRFLRRKEIFGRLEEYLSPEEQQPELQKSTGNGNSNSHVIVDVLWEEVDLETAKEKVSNTFRTRKKMEKRKLEKKNKRKNDI